MEIGDKVIARKEMKGYDPNTFLPYPLVPEGMVGVVTRKEVRRIGGEDIVGYCFEFANEARIVFMEKVDGRPHSPFGPISDSVKLV